MKLSLPCSLLLVAAVLAGRAASQAAAPASRPNILFILIDDMGYADLSCYGNTATQTPHLDRLAAEGIRFTQFSVASPLCSPSRIALTTGQTPARWGITSYLGNRAENERRGLRPWLDPQAPTLARSLQAAGYATGHFGKWHMGGQRDVGEAPLITEYGFAASLTTFEGLGDRVLPLVDDRDGRPARKMPLAVSSEKLGRGRVTWRDRAEVTTAFVQRAMEFIRAAQTAGQPFYVNVWPDDVHSPFFPTAAGRGDATKHALYEGVVHETDAQLAPLLALIREDPALRANTLIVVASDNGPEPGAGSAGPFRGHKGNLYEGGIREPFIVWGPGLVQGAAVNAQTVVNSVDLAPSLRRLAGLPAAPEGSFTDGEDLSAELLGHDQKLRARPLFWIRPPDRPGPENQTAVRWPDLAMRQADWKLLCMEDGSQGQLHDLGKDPGEQKDVAAEHPEVVREMTQAVLAWRRTLPVRPLSPHAELGDVPGGKTSD